MTEINKTKSVIRQQQIARLHDFLEDPDNQVEITRLYESLFTNPQFARSKTLGITLSMDDELDTQPVIQWALTHHIQVAVPRTLPHRQMEFVQLTDDTKLSQTKFGTIEPVGGNVLAKNQLDTLLVPGLAFSKDHYRIGYGGGFYDRFLKGFTGASIALATSVQIFDEPIWNVEDFDVKVNKIIY
ncbi:putative 5-formyltetrahydrofolate cyclo-ligase [Lentilactobacillus sunkii]|jgi:5-formyltetrahydrofolate cyclo-ligase|uniref:5-formyltetrahydrofolate cyclo-ligase n=1 Tax=Lentilactobacillus sunkii TaxID=481719 RepID=A0A1E7XC12_9LACO|nr:5-formyltetrahydrofolate cyclo-ligase [Lentilactobacillus sunkii]OFA10657.1 putative 5-formyltetrahydrofolate cyclo-ligase [Lentilactobacillus sunkii]